MSGKAVTEGWHHWEKQGLMQEAVWLEASLSFLCLRHCQVNSCLHKVLSRQDVLPQSKRAEQLRIEILKQEVRVKSFLLLIGTWHRNSLGSSGWKDHKEKWPVFFLAKCLKCPWVCGQPSPCQRLEDVRSGVWYFLIFSPLRENIPFLETVLKTWQKLYSKAHRHNTPVPERNWTCHLMHPTHTHIGTYMYRYALTHRHKQTCTDTQTHHSFLHLVKPY